MRDNPWKGLPPGEVRSMSVVRVAESKVLDCFWARKQDGRLALLFTLPQLSDLPADLPSVRGVEILVMPDDRQLQLVLASGDDWEMFLDLCLNLVFATDLAADKKEALALLFKRLARWQKLLSRGGPHLLDEREVRGLIGEMLFLRDGLMPALGPSAVDCWQGPEGLPQDFVHSGRLIEVKTHGAGTAPTIRIASPEQLTSDEVPLFLHVIRLVRQDAALSLPILADDIRALLLSDPTRADAFEDKLASLRYVDLPEYRAMTYAVTSATSYEVRDDFPRLTVDRVPPGVIDLSYAIELHSISDYQVETSVLISQQGNVHE